MRICAKCHGKDEKVTECKLGEYVHHLLEWRKCEICGIYNPTFECICYDKLIYKKTGA